MKYEIKIVGKADGLIWVVEAKNVKEAARKMCPPDNDYWEFEVKETIPGVFMPHKKLMNDPLGMVRKKKKFSWVGEWVPFGEAFAVKRVGANVVMKGNDYDGRNE